MASYTFRDVDKAAFEDFGQKAKDAGWSPQRLLEQLMRDYVAGRIAPSIAPPPRQPGR